MSHIARNQPRLLARISRLKGQIEAIERAVQTDTPCGEVLNLVASVRGAVNGLTAELIEHHLRDHISDPDRDPDPARAQASAELVAVIRTYMK
jgi:DNA-binding FrmR family transcriptional regulator